VAITEGGWRYMRAWGIWLALLIGFFLALPYLVYWLVHALGANGSPAAGMLAVVLAVYSKAIAWVIFAAAIAAVCAARTKAIGMPRKVAASITLLVLADIPFGLMFDPGWITAFAVRLSLVPTPASLLAAVIALVALAFIREPTEPRPERYGKAYRLWAALLAFFATIGFMGLLSHFWLLFFGMKGLGLRNLLQTIDTSLRFLTLYPSVPLLLFAAASIHLCLSSREQGGGRADAPQSGGGAARAPLGGRS
jgi:hypothetical protein